MTVKYGKLSGEAIIMLGNVAGKNCMRSKYSKSGISTMDIYNPANKATLEDFQSCATLGIYEYLLQHNKLSKATPEDLLEARRAGYRACNATYNALRQDAKHHLYIVQYTDDGEPLVEIVDVTAEIEQELGEIWESIKPYCTKFEIKLLKMVSMGYTTETIAKKIGKPKSTTFDLIKKAREHAKQGRASK